MGQKRAVLGVFPYMQGLLTALEGLKKENHTVQTVYSPFPRHEIQEALELGPSAVRYFTLFGALLGIALGISLVVYTSVQWRFIVSGKPVIPLVPAVIVGFEFCILFGVLSNLVGMLLKTRLPRFRLPPSYDDRFAQDHFGVVVSCPECDRDRVATILREAGAEEVHDLQR